MTTGPNLEEYLAEVRERVCSRCIERLPGGPPCGPLGRRCGIEVNLERLVQTVHHAHGAAIDPYIDVFHDEVCAHCPARPTRDCPCPLDCLLLLAVEAIEGVDERYQNRSIGAP